MTAISIPYFRSAAFEASATDDTSMHIRILLARHEELFVLPPKLLDALAFAFVEKSYRPGAILVRPGDREPCVFLILQGEIVTRDPHGRESYSFPGQLVSSLSIVEGGAATEKRSARGPLRVAKLSGSTMSMLLGANSEIASALLDACRSESDDCQAVRLSS